MIYISTDYVFPGTGKQFYKPDDVTAPCNVYGQTKLEGELTVKKLLRKYFIVRISWVFGVMATILSRQCLRLEKPIMN